MLPWVVKNYVAVFMRVRIYIEVRNATTDLPYHQMQHNIKIKKIKKKNIDNYIRTKDQKYSFFFPLNYLNTLDINTMSEEK